MDLLKSLRKLGQDYKTHLHLSKDSKEVGHKDGVLELLVTPLWKGQPWYALLLSMLVNWPHLLPHQSC